MPEHALDFTQQLQAANSQDTSGENPLAALLIYLAAIMCADSDTCADFVELVFVAGITIGSMYIATLPGTKLRNNYASSSAVTFANRAMPLLWGLSATAGGYAANKEYHHELRNIYQPDSVDKFNAVTGAAMSGAVVTTLFTAVSAAVVKDSAPRIVTMFGSLKERCRRRSDRGNQGDYNELVDDEAPRRVASPSPIYGS